MNCIQWGPCIPGNQPQINDTGFAKTKEAAPANRRLAGCKHLHLRTENAAWDGWWGQPHERRNGGRGASG